MKIAGKDFRQRAVEARQSGELTREEVAKMFGYTTTTIGNWMRAFKKEGQITSLPRGHRASAFTQRNSSSYGKLCRSSPT